MRESNGSRGVKFSELSRGMLLKKCRRILQLFNLSNLGYTATSSSTFIIVRDIIQNGDSPDCEKYSSEQKKFRAQWEIFHQIYLPKNEFRDHKEHGYVVMTDPQLPSTIFLTTLRQITGDAHSSS